ncbi:carbon-monoxide dehydrogenase medium subunit [Sphaerisporangium melleum]|uniref:Carbon-monoxide dehydrogenase medium subunit n=1 Tax=Sphaerisporangium melleum TaxID=321316 RepID=A0A917QQC9_9ACTN|nr:FAD binding domain-containing protein [Sphaerisporangium melleum]GGK63218.1 carbon-monoxide dehydrogenase medium subunit [Sphaerisporangium melleum]GII68060.1 carbon-monoxide dehydrogenase medium subunit [Sphaerisporangium melleum]
MILTDFDYVKPGTLGEAVALLAAEGSRVLAGGQSLLVDLRTGDGTATRLVDIRGIAALRGVRREGEGRLHIGALTTLAELAADPLVRAGAPALAEAARANGDPQVRNLGTLGGNLAATGRATDLPVAVIAADATINLAGRGGQETLTADAYATRGLPAGAVITSIEVPVREHRHHSAFEKTADRATRYPLCAVAVRAAYAGDGTAADLRIAVTGATARVQRLRGVEELLLGGPTGTGEVLAAFRAQPRDMFVPGRGASAEYLGHLAGVLTARALARAAAR